jgi:hypothetical protein
MAGYSDYYSVIARAISALPVKTDEARQAIYERARTALQERLRTIEPPISETDLAIERFALEAAIERVETASRSSDARHGLKFISTMTQIVRSVRDTLNSNIGIRVDSLTTVITAGLAPGLEFIQRTRLAAHGRRIYSIFGDRQWITKYTQIRIAAGVIVAALVGIFGGIFVHWMTENNREASHSLISPSELAFSDVTLSHPDNHWEIKGVVKNDSPHTVVAFRLKITVRDCDSACVTIGEEVKRIVINIPPSQTRIIEGDLFSSETLIPKTLDWSYEIVETDAK